MSRSSLKHRSLPQAATAAALCALVAGCTVGPDYKRPDAAAPPAFKEAAGWVPSHPTDAIDKGAWWSIFNDPTLDGLERRVATSNQTVKQFEAAYREAHQIVAEARSSFFPTLGVTAGADRSKGSSSTGVTTGSTATTGATTATGSTSGHAVSSYSATLEASWVPDLWGKVRRTVESDKALAQAAAADIANARLSAEASLAQDYFQVRQVDEEVRLFTRTVQEYERLVKLTQDQVREGTQPQSALLTAQTQLYGAQSSLVGLGVTRAKMEHAVAVLVGVPPSELSIPAADYSRDVPTPPTTVPGTLLERRPDIAGAERRMASANALIGVAVSAYFPDVTLSGDYGAAGSNIGHLFNASNTLWSFGADASETLLDFGLRKAQVRAARAVYDENVATYRQTVLTAFQGVEDELASLRIFQQQQEVLLRTEEAARQTLKLDLDEYREGTIDYTTVIAAEASLLSASVDVLNVILERQQASVLLVENLGGGWTAADLAKS